jgi:NADH-quinone oxidoreductase subunit A
MSLTLFEICKLIGFTLLLLVLSVIILLLSYSLSVSAPDIEKLSSSECGFDPYEDARNVFDIRFYLVAILFIVFDLEAVFFYPWCVSLSFLNLDAFWGMIDFILELLLGFLYAWKVGALDWE